MIAKLISSTAKPGAAPAPAAATTAPGRAAPPLTGLPIPSTAPAELSQPGPPVAAVTAENPRIDVGVRPADGSYQITMIVTNTSDKLLPFRFGSSQTYDVVIADGSGKEVWRWSNGNFFTQVVRSDSIRGGAKWRFDVTWDRKDNNGNRVPPGEYRITAFLTSLPRIQATPVVVEIR
jgi:hypothetical protein